MTATLTAERVEMTFGDHANFQLDATFRCDRCGAQAYIKAVFRSTNDEGQHKELYFCSHHANAYERPILPLLKEWHDERERLKEDRKTGSEN